MKRLDDDKLEPDELRPVEELRLIEPFNVPSYSSSIKEEDKYDEGVDVHALL